MYDIVRDIIAHSWSTGSSDQQYIYYICGALICLLVVLFVDVIRGIFRSFMRG